MRKLDTAGSYPKKQGRTYTCRVWHASLVMGAWTEDRRVFSLSSFAILFSKTRHQLTEMKLLQLLGLRHTEARRSSRAIWEAFCARRVL
ncbi:hypothetical protein DL93DRAFT_235174 [Clavulina sp. PMI_390]|nr:hypothetical protein DL93DRAFT_235174 [Clavulina sp. PMI_390]